MTFSNNSLSPIFADRAYTYKVTSAPAVTPISVAEVKSFAKISTSSDDAIITMMIETATRYAEQFTHRDFITRTYETFRDQFPGDYQGFGYSTSNSGNYGFELRRSPLQSIESVKYVDSAGSPITIASTVYYNTIEEDFSTLLTQVGQTWPTDAIEQQQSITIEFKTGFGDAATDCGEEHLHAAEDESDAAEVFDSFKAQLQADKKE